MANRTTNETVNQIGAVPTEMLQFGEARTGEMLHMQKEILDAYQEAGKAWVDRVKSEVAFWSELAQKLAASRSVPEGLETYREGISQRLQMAAEDGQRLLEQGQKIAATVTSQFSNGLPEPGKRSPSS
jgi:hypothetical protein